MDIRKEVSIIRILDFQLPSITRPSTLDKVMLSLHHHTIQVYLTLVSNFTMLQVTTLLMLKIMEDPIFKVKRSPLKLCRAIQIRMVNCPMKKAQT